MVKALASQLESCEFEPQDQQTANCHYWDFESCKFILGGQGGSGSLGEKGHISHGKPDHKCFYKHSHFYGHIRIAVSATGTFLGSRKKPDNLKETCGDTREHVKLYTETRAQVRSKNSQTCEALNFTVPSQAVRPLIKAINRRSIKKCFARSLHLLDFDGFFYRLHLFRSNKT